MNSKRKESPEETPLFTNLPVELIDCPQESNGALRTIGQSGGAGGAGGAGGGGRSAADAAAIAHLGNQPDFVRIEKNIASFGFFGSARKRTKNNDAKVITFSHMVDGVRVDGKVTISGNALYGMPTTADLDKYLAFQKILERIKRETGKIENPIRFSSAELLHLLDQSDGGKNFHDVGDWLDVMASTYIKSEGAVYIAGRKKFASDSFVIFQRVRRQGQELDDGSIADQNYIWLSDWYLENLNHHYLLPVDFDTYKQLKTTTAKALIPLLQLWLYATRDHGCYEKNYDALCDLINISKYNYQSKIKDILAPSMTELTEHGYLAGWDVQKTSDGEGFKIVFWHGRKFYRDRESILAKSKRKHELQDPRRRTPSNPNQRYTVPPDSQRLFDRLRLEFDVAEPKAVDLLRQFDHEEIENQLNAFELRSETIDNKPGYIIRAIENKFSLPEGYRKLLAARAQQKAMQIESRIIEDCHICDESGTRNIKSERDSFFGVSKECTHDHEIESQFETHLL